MTFLFMIAFLISLYSYNRFYLYSRKRYKKLPPSPVLSKISVRPLHFSHRGGGSEAGGEYPENTIEAFRSSVHQHKTDGLELDIHFTRDGHPVVMHDATLERTTNGKGRIQDKTLSEIRMLDAAFHFDPMGNYSFPLREEHSGRKIEVPTLQKVFETFQEFKDLLFILDVKSNAYKHIPKLHAIVSQYQMEDRIIIGSFYYWTSRKLKKVFHKSASFYHALGISYLWFLHRLHLTPYHRPRHHSLQAPVKGLLGFRIWCQRLVKECEAMGIEPMAWVINEEKEMKELFHMGIKAIESDYPSKLRLVVDEIRGLNPVNMY